MSRWNGREMSAGGGENDDDTGFDFRGWDGIQKERGNLNGTYDDAKPQATPYPPPEDFPTPTYQAPPQPPYPQYPQYSQMGAAGEPSTFEKAKPLLIGALLGGVAFYFGQKWWEGDGGMDWGSED